MLRTEHRLCRLWTAITRRTPAYECPYRPAPATLAGQLWAALTRSTPAFAGSRPSDLARGSSAPGQLSRADNARIEIGVFDDPPVTFGRGSVLGSDTGSSGHPAKSLGPSQSERPGQLTPRAVLQDALTRLRLAGFSADNRVVRVATEEADLTATVTADPEQERVSIEFRIAFRRIPMADLAGIGITAISIGGLKDSSVRHLAVVDAAGRAVFPSVAAGQWTFDTVERVLDGSVGYQPLPLPRFRSEDYALAASDDYYAVVLPSGVLYIVHAPRAEDSFKLEVVCLGDHTGLFPVTYTDDKGSQRSLLVPVARTGTESPRSQVWMRGYAPHASWWTGDAIDPARLTQRERSLINESIDAAADKATQRAWRGLTEIVTPEVAEIILMRIGR